MYPQIPERSAFQGKVWVVTQTPFDATKGSSTNAANLCVLMAKSDDVGDEDDEAEMLPDERAAIAERLDSLADEARHSLSEVVDELDSDD